MYVQIAVFLGFVTLYLITHRRLHAFRLFSFAAVRIVFLVALFIYLFLNWSSEVNPSLRNASVLGMFIVNLYMLWQVILTRLELTYRLALEACGRNPDNRELIHRVVAAGKRFFYTRYFWQALVSGISLQRFLQGVAREEVRYDLQKALRQHSPGRQIINFQMQMAYLKKQLSEDESFPQEFKDVMIKAIDDSSGHPWIKEQMNRFLAQAMEAPEELVDSSWSGAWEKTVAQGQSFPA